MKNNSTEISLFTKTSDDRILQWDKTKIIKSLEKETGLKEDIARRIANEVEFYIKENKLKIVTTTLIRELVNAQLISCGLIEERNKYCRLGMSIRDIKDCIIQQNKENANIPHNPEATNLTIAGNIKKEFALLEIFPKKVSEAHLRGDIHLHDLDYIDRCYTFDSRESIIIKNSRNNMYCVSFQNLFKLSKIKYKENNVEIGLLDDFFILDKNNSWTKIKRIIKKEKKRQMFWVKSKNSKSIILTDNHPFIINDNGKEKTKEVKNLTINDNIFTNNELKINQDKTFFNLIEIPLCSNDKNRVYYIKNIYIILDNKRIKLNEITVNDLKQLQEKKYFFDLTQSVIYSKSLNGNNKSQELPVLFNLTEKFCYLIGLFIAEGNYEKNTITLSIGEEYKDKIINILNEYKFPFNIKKREECYTIRIYSSILNDLIYNYFSIGRLSKNICLPNSFISWKPKYSFALLSGIIDGDGCINQKRINIRCSSRQMLTQINWLLLSQKMKCCNNLNGGIGSIRYYKGKEIKQNYDIYGIEFGIPKNKKYLFEKSKKCENIESTEKFYYYDKDNIRKIKPIETQEKYIYDITTESGTFICNGILVHNCSGNNIEYIKKFGLNFPNALSIAKPAKHPEVLIAHILKFSAALQGVFAGAIGWDAVNIFIAPYLVGMDYDEIKQLAQILIFEFSQQAVARGGQAIFSDINLYWEIPKHFENIEAIGPGGKYTGKKYKEYLKESQQFIVALFDIYLEGDGSERPFMFPKPNIHITENFFKTYGHEEFLELVSEVASKMGNPYFIFDRGAGVKISECCRLKFSLSEEDIKESTQPWKMRFSALQNVTINLPRIAYEAKGDYGKIIKILTQKMELAAKAHIYKRKFIERLLKKGHNGPLSLLTMNLDGETYLRFHKTTHLIGMVGLNEMIKAYSGQELHQSKKAFIDGLKIITLMYDITKELSKKHGINFVLEQTPAESTAYRFASLDIDNFSEATFFVKGNLKNREVYYTNSTQLSVDSYIDPIKRVTLEGKFHGLIEAGSMTHLWIGEHRPDKKAISSFIKNVFKNTSNDQICFSPEFTSCKKCFKTSRGLHEKCVHCGSKNIEGITRITGYFSKINNWNPGKIQELRDRKKWKI